MFKKAKSDDVLDDSTLIEKYKQTGDIAFLGILYERYMHLVYGVCLKYLKNREESQDATMQIFEKLVDNLKKHEVQNFKSWLHVTAKNHCLMYLRSQKNKHSEEFSDTIMENDYMLHPTDDSTVKLEEDITKLELCIEQLQNEQKACIQLFYLQKKSYKEIEQITDFELKKVKSHIQNGKRNLKLCIEGK